MAVSVIRWRLGLFREQYPPMAKLSEIQHIESLLKLPGVRSEVLALSEWEEVKLPIYKINFGSEDPEAPVLGFVGGVHGLERIGSQVCVSLMSSLSELIQWDVGLQQTLKNLRVFFIPVVNPVGVYRKTRSNPRGVDLMRNAPVDADNPAPWVGGHRLSNKLPWFRGELGAPMEVESQALVSAVEKEISKSPFVITLDIHSGFGFKDRLWFPYAKTTSPFPDLPLAEALKNLLDRTYPHHFYQVEPQAQSYTTHGDLWDYIYDNRLAKSGRPGTYLPLCLEMGSWLWVKKNPWQIFRPEGTFNPSRGHRQRRILRRHNTLMEFLIRAVTSHASWVNEQKKVQENWYEVR